MNLYINVYIMRNIGMVYILRPHAFGNEVLLEITQENFHYKKSLVKM